MSGTGWMRTMLVLMATCVVAISGRVEAQSEFIVFKAKTPLDKGTAAPDSARQIDLYI